MADLRTSARAHLRRKVKGPAYVGVEQIGSQTLTATVYTPEQVTGYVVPYSFQAGKAVFGAATATPVHDLHQPLVRTFLTALKRDGLEETLTALGAATRKLSAERDQARANRNACLVELYMRWGWTTQSDLYTLVDMQRTELERWIGSASMADLIGHDDGAAAVAAALEFNKVFHRKKARELTQRRLRDALIRDLRAAEVGPSEIARIAAVTHARIAQVCKGMWGEDLSYTEYRKQLRGGGNAA